MTRPPAPSRAAAPGLVPGGILTVGLLVGAGVLCVLLAAVLRLVRPRALGWEGTMEVVARCTAEAEAPIFEEWVEWVAVPAPWRHGQLLPRRHEWTFGCVPPARRMRPRAAGRGPPWGFLSV